MHEQQDFANLDAQLHKTSTASAQGTLTLCRHASGGSYQSSEAGFGVLLAQECLPLCQLYK
jgi:hypothetical protein